MRPYCCDRYFYLLYVSYRYHNNFLYIRWYVLLVISLNFSLLAQSICYWWLFSLGHTGIIWYNHILHRKFCIFLYNRSLTSVFFTSKIDIVTMRWCSCPYMSKEYCLLPWMHFCVQLLLNQSLFVFVAQISQSEIAYWLHCRSSFHANGHIKQVLTCLQRGDALLQCSFVCIAMILNKSCVP